MKRGESASSAIMVGAVVGAAAALGYAVASRAARAPPPASAIGRAVGGALSSIISGIYGGAEEEGRRLGSKVKEAITPTANAITFAYSEWLLGEPQALLLNCTPTQCSAIGCFDAGQYEARVGGEELRGRLLLCTAYCHLDGLTAKCRYAGLPRKCTSTCIAASLALLKSLRRWGGGDAVLQLLVLSMESGYALLGAASYPCRDESVEPVCRLLRSLGPPNCISAPPRPLLPVPPGAGGEACKAAGRAAVRLLELKMSGSCRYCVIQQP